LSLSICTNGCFDLALALIGEKQVNKGVAPCLCCFVQTIVLMLALQLLLLYYSNN